VHAGRRVLEGDSRGPGLIALLGGEAALLEPERWRGETIDAVAWKFFPACFASHTAIEALLSLGPIDAATVERVVVHRPAGLLDAAIAAGPHEGGLYDRLMSLRWVLARALELGHYEYPDAVADQPSTLELAKKVDLIHDPALDALPPGTAAVNLEVHGARTVRRLEYRRPTGSDPPTRGTTVSGALLRGWTATLDESALRRKFDQLIGPAPLGLAACADLEVL